MERVIVIGSPGAGKSTFARQLRDRTGLPLFYLDMIWQLPDRTTITREELDRKLSDILKTDFWIIDGNYGRTLELRLRSCDTVFLLDYPLDVCLASAEARIGKQREDLPWTEEDFDEEFRQWIIDYPSSELPRIYKLLDRYGAEKEVHIFKTREEADQYLSRI